MSSTSAPISIASRAEAMSLSMTASTPCGGAGSPATPPPACTAARSLLFEGRVGTLRRFKDDANEVRAGLECGIRLDGFDGYQEGDVIECVEIQKVRASL